MCVCEVCECVCVCWGAQLLQRLCVCVKCASVSMCEVYECMCVSQGAQLLQRLCVCVCGLCVHEVCA